MINKEIYTLNQEELQEYILRSLKEKDIPYKTDSYGNIWSIRFKQNVVFVAHLDTVARTDDEYHKPVYEIDGILFKNNAVLGGDDRAGVNLILNHIENVNFCFTKDEEVGALGAAELARNEEFKEDIKDISGFVELDRKGDSDIIGYLHGYCCESFLNAITDVLDGHRDTHGVFTDIDKFKHLKSGVNISVGYYNAHTPQEILDIEYFEYLDSKIMELASITGEFEPPKEEVRTYSRGSYYRYLYDDIYPVKSGKKNKCSLCGKTVDYRDGYKINGEILCPDCFDKMI